MLSDACVFAVLWACVLFSAGICKGHNLTLCKSIKRNSALYFEGIFHVTLLYDWRFCFSSVMFLVSHCWVPLSWSSPLISRNFTSSLPRFRFPWSLMNWRAGTTFSSVAQRPREFQELHRKTIQKIHVCLLTPSSSNMADCPGSSASATPLVGSW